MLTAKGARLSRQLDGAVRRYRELIDQRHEAQQQLLAITDQLRAIHNEIFPVELYVNINCTILSSLLGVTEERRAKAREELEINRKKLDTLLVTQADAKSEEYRLKQTIETLTEEIDFQKIKLSSLIAKAGITTGI